MALTTYNELKQKIEDTLNRTDLDSHIPDFIRLAEKAFNRDIRHWRMEKRANATLDTQYSSLPDDFLEPIRLSITSGNTSTLEMVGTFEISKLRMEADNTTGTPRNFTLIDGSIEVFPTPDTAYDLQILYYTTIENLANSTDNNWLLLNHPDAYLYGSLIHSAPFLMEDERTATWAALYKAAISAINTESVRSKTSGSGGRIKIRSY
tara:strand:+ start:475 stop:1095 length:621 start_codon:yes stop_codon:yes gene_type:complete